MLLPEQTYRWLASVDILPDEGISLSIEAELTEKNLVIVPPHMIPHFQSGYIIAQTVRSILKRAQQKIPSCLDNIRMDTSKNAKLTNWNFVWISFEDLKIQFDPRIKDLILQGENALIIEIVKQLSDRDDKKNHQQMRNIKLKQKLSIQKIEKTVKNPSKTLSLDVKKINLLKNPDDSDSSLEYLILLLATSLGLTIEQILGLFTNQNKYLAHIIVKGLNGDFSGIILFYTLLNKHSAKLKHFCQVDPNDAFSCLYAIKPGLISKEIKVAELSIELFGKVGNIYDWFVSDSGKGANTLLLGIKRHPYLIDFYWNLLLQIIKDQESEFFVHYFKNSFRDDEEMIQVCLSLIQPISHSFLKEKLLDLGVLSQWIESACKIYENSQQSRLLSFQFIGFSMLCLPESVQQVQECLHIYKIGWNQYKMTQFTTLFNEFIQILTKLAQTNNNFAGRIYQILIQIFVQVYEEPQKSQYIVENFSILASNFPKLPTHFFVETYREKYLNPLDYILISICLEKNEDIQGLAKIAETLMGMFLYDSVANHYQAPLINDIAKKIVKEEVGQNFIRKGVKDCLHLFAQIQTQKKIPQVAKPQPMYFNFKGNSQKLTENQVDTYKIKQRQSHNLIQLVDRLAEHSKSLNNDSLETHLREQLLNTNAFIRKNTFKAGNKKLSSILRKFGISKEDQQDYDEEYRNRKEIQILHSSLAHKKEVAKNISQLVAQKVSTGPEHLKKEFNQMIKRRRKEEEEKKEEIQKKIKQEAVKETLIRKELEMAKIIRGYGNNSEFEPKQQGFWDRFIKEDKQVEVYPLSLMEIRDTEYIQNLLKKYHKAIRFLFLKYTSSMYSIKSTHSFEDNQKHKETINSVELIKFLKDYNLFALTNSGQIQQFVRDINVKLLNRRQTQELQFAGFQQFLIQFSAVIFTKPHLISVMKKKGQETVKNSRNHLPHFQLLSQLLNHIKMIFEERGQNSHLFNEPDAAYFNETQVIKEFNKKIEKDPNFILPEGYKKVTEKIMNFNPILSEKATRSFKEKYLDVYMILDEILFDSPLKLHLIQPMSEKQTKIKVKPQVFANVKPRLMGQSLDLKRNTLSSIIDRKTPLPPQKILQRKVLSFGMKLGLSYIGYKDKLLGEQVAFVLDDMLTAVQNGRNTIEKEKIVNDIVKKRKQMEELQRRNEEEKERKRRYRKEELGRLMIEKREKQEQQKRQQKERQLQKKLSREKKIKSERGKYLQEKKFKEVQKKKKEEEQKKKDLQKQKKKIQDEKKSKAKFKQFNKKQIEKIKQRFEKNVEEKKKMSEQIQQNQRHEEQVKRKLRSKIRFEDRKIIQVREKNNEEIKKLYNSAPIAEVFKEFRPNLKGIFEFLVKNTYLSITQRKHNNEIILETWHYFNYTFQLNPLIISAKQVHIIFKSLTKDKELRKQYLLGLNFPEFEQALLRIAIKHKTVFNKLSQKIKQDVMSDNEINEVVSKDIQQKEKGQFDEDDGLNIKSLLVEQDINKDIIDDYGEINKVTPQTLKGLIYYLKVPSEKKRQEERFRQILSQKLQSKHDNYQKLKSKLRQQYTLSPKKKIKPKSQEKKPPQPPKKPQKKKGK